MRIGLIVPWLEVGGVETFVFLLGRYLQEAGDQVEIVATQSTGAWFDRAQQMGLPATCLLESDALSPARHARRVARFLTERGFEVCLLNHARFAQASLGLLEERVVAVPVVHNDLEVVYEVGCGNAAAWNVTVAVSPKVFERTRQLAPGKPLMHIPYGIELPEVDFQHHDFESPRLRVLFVGRLLHSQKGVLLLPEILDACRKTGQRLDLTIVGDGPDGPALRERLASLGLMEMVKLQGALSRDKVVEEMSRAQVLLMPSFYEGLGIAMLEAAAHGCVPVVSRLPGITDSVLNHGESGFLIEPGRVEQFVSSIGLLATDRAVLKKMAVAARQAVEDRFSISVMGRAYRELFVRCVRGEFPLLRPRSRLPKLDRRLVGWRDRLIQRRRLQQRLIGKLRTLFLRTDHAYSLY